MSGKQGDERAIERIEERLDTIEQTFAALDDQIQTATNRDIPLLKGTIRALLGDEPDGISMFPDAGRDVHRHIEAHEERISELEDRMATLSDVGSTTSTKAEKFAAILSFAMNKQSTNDKVSVSPNEIKGCTGVSRRYAYELLDAMADELDGVGLREEQQVKTSTGTKRKGKALLVDCETVHDADRTMNQFTTGGRTTSSE